MTTLTGVTNRDVYNDPTLYIKLMNSSGVKVAEGFGTSGDHYTQIFHVSTPDTYYAVVADGNGRNLQATSNSVTVP